MSVWASIKAKFKRNAKKERRDAVEKRVRQKGDLGKYQNRDARWQTAETSDRYRNVESW